MEMEGKHDGVKLLLYIKAQKLPVKTVVVSSITQEGSIEHLCGQNMGAFRIIPKPNQGPHSAFGRENSILEAGQEAGAIR